MSAVMMASEVYERVLARTEREGDCLVFTGSTSNGYGKVNVNGHTRLTHRIAWEAHNGAIPDGIFVCHHCDNRRCLNVEHLFLGTNTDNMRDSSGKGRNKNQKKTHCPQGHPYDEANTYRDSRGSRWCRTCIRAKLRRYKARLKAERNAVPR